MVIAKTNYSETLDKIYEIREKFKELEVNIYSQIASGVTEQYNVHRDKLFNWLQEMEFDLIEKIN